VSVKRRAEPTIRLAEYDDAERLAAFMNAIRSENLPGLYVRGSAVTPEVAMRIIGEHSASQVSVLLLADRFGRLVGMLDMTQRSQPSQAHCAYCQIFVGKSDRRSGVGTALLADLISRIEDAREIRRLEAEVLETNTASLGLCARFGLVVEGKKRDAVLVDGAYVENVMLARLWPDHWPVEHASERREPQ
jgi:putative acetyltransferase